jgi:hypothetical protein
MAASSVREHWRQLEHAIHPADVKFFPNPAFDLAYPPPAFIGDVDHAPVVILLSHGGYDPIRTPEEFDAPGDVETYLRWLKEGGDIPEKQWYYLQRHDARFIQDGSAVIVNAVAYRCKNMDRETKKFAQGLPSTAVHRNWLRSEVMPAAKSGQRLIIAHQWSLWGLRRGDFAGADYIRFSRAPITKNLDREMLQFVGRWLAERRR